MGQRRLGLRRWLETCAVQIMQKNQQEHFFEQAWSNADFDGLDELIHPQALFHIRNQTFLMGAQETRKVISSWHHSFPDFHFSIEAMVAEVDLVAVRLILSGTHQARWRDIPATGKKIRVTVMMFLRYDNEKLVEIWEDYDETGMHRQLSVK
jgi:predicted ester cyclase